MKVYVLYELSKKRRILGVYDSIDKAIQADKQAMEIYIDTDIKEFEINDLGGIE